VELLVLIIAALAICTFYGVVALAILINFDVVPRPEPGEIAARLDWHRSPRVRLLPSSRVANPALTAESPSAGYVRTYALAVMVVIPLAVGDTVPTMTASGGAGTGAPPALMLPLIAGPTALTTALAAPMV
jgi:hypothetical protein